MPLVAAIDAINSDIATLESLGLTAKYINGVFRAQKPDLHGILTCMRDQRKYDPKQIEKVCKFCPHYDSSNKSTDDSYLLDDCKEILFNGTSIDGKTRYFTMQHDDSTDIV
jgi:hypothetical protein